MLVGRGVAQDVNNLMTDANTFRNEDYVSNQALSYSRGDGIGAVAAQYSMVQLLNPSGSGVVILLDRIMIRSTVGEFCRLNQYDTAFATAANYGAARKIGGTASQGAVRVQTAGAVPGTGIDSYGNNTAAPLIIADKFPIILDEGVGIVIGAGAVNGNMYVSFVWREV